MATKTAPLEQVGYRFGVFEVVLHTRVLLRSGRPIKIQKFPIEILLTLLQEPGTIVSREELKSRLWGDQTYVQFDNGLQVGVAKLREALGETGAKSNFIQTIPGAGYKFVGDVESVYSKSIPEIDLGAPFIDLGAFDQEKHVPRTGFLAALCLIIVVAAVGWLALGRHAGPPTVGSTDTTMIGPFVNSTGKPELDRVFETAFRVKLQESPYLLFARDTRPEQNANRDLPGKAEPSLRTCRESGAQILVSGQLANQSSGYQISVSARRCSDGKQLFEQTAYAGSTASILPALGEAVESLRRRMGEPVDKRGRFNTSIAQATTDSPAAMKAFSLGDEKRSQGMNAEAVAEYKLAVSLDPQFALAYARLGAVYGNLGDGNLSNQYFTKAFQLRERSTDRERLYIAGHYFSDITGELQEGIQTYQLWRGMYPYDPGPANNLALQYIRAGQPEKALDPASDAVRLNPSDALAQTTLAQAYLGTGDFAKLNELCRETAISGKGTMLLRSTCFRSSFAQNDDAGMQREVQWAGGHRAEAILLDDEAEVALAQGRLREARRLLMRAAQLAERNIGSETAAEIYLDAALMEADYGSASDARLDAQKALGADPSGILTQGFAALTFARAGDAAKARLRAKEASRSAPLNTILNAVVLSSVAASIDLKNHRANHAVISLEGARPYDFNMIMPFATAYYRGLAYEADRKPQLAIVEFERIAEFQRIDPSSSYLQLARLEQGRVLQELGERQRAIEIFHLLGNLWKTADPDFPPLLRLRQYEREIQVSRAPTKPEAIAIHVRKI